MSKRELVNRMWEQCRLSWEDTLSFIERRALTPSQRVYELCCALNKSRGLHRGWGSPNVQQIALRTARKLGWCL